MPVYGEMQSVEPENIKALTLEYYPKTLKKTVIFGRKQDVQEDSCYIHYQDNGVDFAYEDGEYNLYEFMFSEKRNNGLQVKMLHEGFSGKYEEITAVIC